MADLNVYSDQVIVFEAINALDSSRLHNRQPLRPTNNQLLSPSRKAQERLQGMQDVKPDIPKSREQAPSRDENRGVQHGSRPSQACLPVDARINHTTNLPNTSSPTPSYHSPPASHWGTIAPAIYRPPAYTPASLPPQSQNTSNHDTHRNSKMSLSSTVPPDVDGFHLFCHRWHERFRISYPGNTAGMYLIVSGAFFFFLLTLELNIEQLHNSLVNSWRKMLPSERDAWVIQARPSQVKTEIKTEPKLITKIQNAPAVHEPPISAAELEEQNKKTFQLQTLFKDANPQMLESSVEQGVKLLERLKAPLIENL